jgi:hypothetical protein
LEVVPSKWVINDVKCHFPDSKVAGALGRKNVDVNIEWTVFDIRVLRKLGE